MKITMVLEGHPTIVGNLQRLTTSVTRQGNTNAWNGAQHLYARSRAVVPYLNGEIYESAFIKNIGEKNFPMWAVGYDTVAVQHALPVHEIPNRDHPTRGPSPEPKQDHYLSEPRDQMAKSFVRDVAEGARHAISKTQFQMTPMRRRR